MDTYLHIAETVLKAVKRPLSAKSILAEAYKADLVPYRLHGKTQHKTLQARLSIDILSKREKSVFFRTAPGRFFIREFLDDPSIPVEFRNEVFARRRTRTLVKGPVLSVSRSRADAAFSGENLKPPTELLNNKHEKDFFRYEPLLRRSDKTADVWVFSVVRKNDELLSFRCGNYRDYRDSFAQKRSIGFSSMVAEECRTLFNVEDFGISDCGLSAIVADLNISESRSLNPEDSFSKKISSFMLAKDRGRTCVVAILEVNVPDWFHPVNPSLSINDLIWINCEVLPNNIEDYDPWSETLIRKKFFSRGRHETPL